MTAVSKIRKLNLELWFEDLKSLFCLTGRPSVNYRPPCQSYEMIPLGDKDKMSEDLRRKIGVVARDQKRDDQGSNTAPKTHQIHVVNTVETTHTQSTKKVLGSGSLLRVPNNVPKIVIEEEQKSCPTEIMEYRWPFTMYYMKAYIAYDAGNDPLQSKCGVVTNVTIAFIGFVVSGQEQREVSSIFIHAFTEFCIVC